MDFTIITIGTFIKSIYMYGFYIYSEEGCALYTS
nr:MAG TPA: hypothetical protein [Caudoviricetes sp.]